MADTKAAVVERLVLRGGLEVLPQAQAAIDRANQQLEKLNEQQGRLLPAVIAADREQIKSQAIADINDAYARAEAERTKSFADERGRVITATAGVDVMPQTAAERRALEATWATEIPALVSALPHIDNLDELVDAADVALVREHGLAIRTLLPAIVKRLGEMKDADPRAEVLRAELSGRLAEWRRAHPTHRARAAAVESREAQIRSGLQRSRDMLLVALGWRNRYEN